MSFGALVSAGAFRLGAAVVRELERRGGHVIVLDLQPGEAGEHVEGDVAASADVQRVLDQASSAYGGLRVAVSCAGIRKGERILGREGPHNRRASSEPYA